MTDNAHPLPTPSTSPFGLSRDGGPIPLHWVEDLFERLSAILGGAMSNVYASADPVRVKAEWAEALGGFSADEVKRGLAACRTRKFAPNLGEFLHLCRPALDPEIGFIEAEKGLRAHADGIAFAWSHPAVYWAARGMAYEVRGTAYAHIRKRWEHHLAEHFAVGRWAPIPAAPAARLVHDRQTVGRDEIDEQGHARVAERLREVRQKLTAFAAQDGQDAQDASGDKAEIGARMGEVMADVGRPKDRKAWAKRLRDREHRGERLSGNQRTMWRAALGIGAWNSTGMAAELERQGGNAA